MPEHMDPAHRIFVSYIDKSREYYLAQDFGNPYRWASNAESPFAPLKKPLAQSRVGLVTTSSLPVGAEGLAPLDIPRIVYSAPSDPPPERMYTQHRSWDKEATHTDDLDSFFPIHRLQELVRAGRIGSVSPRFYGVPTEYSQRKTIEQDAPEVLRLMRDDGVDVALLVPLCPVCHQTASLTARHLEANGIPTVIAGSARDIVEQCAVPRLLFTDFPLGNPCGMPYDVGMQRVIVGMSFDLLERAWLPQTTVQTPFHWPNDVWRDNFMRVDESNIAALREAGAARRAHQAARKVPTA
jgi:hypothetical protein